MESREAKVGKITNEQERLQYDGQDEKRIRLAMIEFTDSTVHFINSVSDFEKEATTEVHEDSARDMQNARQEMVEKYASLQVALNRLGYVFRIDGESAVDKMVDFIEDPEVKLDMSGL